MERVARDDMIDQMYVDRRKSSRTPCSGVVTLAVQAGPLKGAAYVGLLCDISDGGLAVMLDGGCLTRGTSVIVDITGLPVVPAWVCHSTQGQDGWRVGLSFAYIPAEVADSCWEPELCRCSVA